MSENERLIKAFYNLHKKDAEIFDDFKKYFDTGYTLGSIGVDDDKSFRFAQKLIRSELPMYKALRSILPPDAISAKRYRQFVRNSFSVFPAESVSPIRRDWTDQAAKSFFATRNNIDHLEYLSDPKDNWVGYDPNNGPLAQRFHELEAVDAQRQFRIRNAGKRKSSLSGIAATDELANLDRINSRLDFLDRLRTFRRATQASGFSRYARAERESNERIDYERELEAEELHRRRMSDKSFEFEMLDKDEQFIQGAMRDKGWSREQAEQVYFKNLTENTKWLRFIAKDNPKIAKNLIPIAKAVGKAGGLPFIGGLATNPALAAVGAAMFVSSEYSKAIKENLNWVNLISAGGGISGDALSAAAGGGLDYASALKLVQGSKRTAAKWKFGEGLDGIFRSTMYGADVSVFNPFATGEDRLRMIYNATKNIKDDGDRLAALEMWGASVEEYNQGRRLETPREQWSIEERISDRARQWKDWREWAKVHGTAWDKINAYTSPDWWIDFWSAREEIGEDKRKEFMSNLPFANTWDEVHDTAEIDDRYRAGMYDNSVTNNGGDKSVTVIQNISAEVKNEDPVGFVKEMTLLGGRGKHEAESVLQNNDSLRTN